MFGSLARHCRHKQFIWSLCLSLCLAGGVLLPEPVQASLPATLLAQADAVHIVQPGDTLTNIASRYGLTVTELMQLNGLQDRDFVYVGQQLIVAEPNAETATDATPAVTPSLMATVDVTATLDVMVTLDLATPEATATNYTTYTIQAGDNLSSVASAFDTTTARLLELNGLGNANLVRVGQVLMVPQPAPQPTTTTVPTTAPTPTTSPTSSPTALPPTSLPTPTATPEPAALTTTYTVRTGDTLSTIAERFGTSTSELLQLNGLGNANLVRVGQRLTVPIARDPNSLVVLDPTRINFATGATNASVDGTVIFPEQACYLLGADAGQEMTVRLTTDERAANFFVQMVEADSGTGVYLKEPTVTARSWTQVLPRTGDYLLCVATAEGAAIYDLSVSIPAACRSVTQAIQTLDWESFLATDEALSQRTVGDEEYVAVATDATELTGIPQVEQIAYGDFDGDCEEEAGIPLFSGGTAGNIGYLLYDYTGDEQTGDKQTGDEAGTARPTLVTWGTGYKLSLAADAGILVVSNALYNGWEPNCCPSGRSHASYHLDEGELVLLATTSTGNDGSRALAVEHFYQLLEQGEFVAAYALLSPAVQAENPYERWVAGYAQTETVAVSTTVDSDVPNRLLVDLEVTERLSSGTARIRHYRGYWDLRWDPVAASWTLQAGNFAVVP